MPDQSIGALGEQLLQREMARDPEQFKQPITPAPKRSGMSPQTLATIGGLADAASTYYSLKTGRGRETNALLGATNSHPEMTALGALGGLAASKGITSLINRFSPRAADAVAANLGALQSAYAVGNLNLTRARGGGNNPSVDYQRTMTDKVIKGQ
jgi:hypothetical protein